MEKRTAIVFSLVVAVIITILLFIVKLQYDALNKYKGVEDSIVEMKQLKDNIARNEAKYVTEERLKQFAKESNIDLKPIQDDLKDLNAEIKGINKVTSSTPGGVFVTLPSTSSEPRKDEAPNEPLDKYGYLKNKQFLKLDEPLSNGKKVPWGQVGFSAWEKNPWEYSVLPRKYTTVNVISTNEDGRHFAHSKMYVEVDGKKENLPISDAKFVEQYPESKFKFYPRLYLGLNGAWKVPSQADAIPDLILSLFNFGKLKEKPDWTFLGLGFGYAVDSKQLLFQINPVNYNVSRFIPFTNNLFVGPSFGVDFERNSYISIGVHSGL